MGIYFCLSGAYLVRGFSGCGILAVAAAAIGGQTGFGRIGSFYGGLGICLGCCLDRGSQYGVLDKFKLER